jgi:hypothetical protein
VSEVREVERRSLSFATEGYARVAQIKWAAWLRKHGLAAQLPTDFATLLATATGFADPVLEDRARQSTWQARIRRWA